MNWYLKVLQNYAVFSGRARRKEFWMFTLFNAIFVFIAIIIDNIAGLNFEYETYGTVYLIYNLGVIIPSLAVSVRRLHDIGKSGYWLFVGLIPIVGAIWLIVLFAQEGDSYENEYGSNPKE